MKYSVDELGKMYSLELDRIVEKINKDNPKTILLQLPDGLKHYAMSIVDTLQEKTGHKDIRIFLGNCFGACDIPNTSADLIIQFGHAPWGKKEFNEM